MIVLKQLIGFAAVGGCGALIDWGVFCWLSGGRRAWKPVCASLVSTTCAMAWTFAANFAWVFHPAAAEEGVRMAKFLAVTCLSAWVLQSGTLRLVGPVMLRLIQPKVGMLAALPGLSRLDAGSLARKSAKAVAMGAGLVWNFLWYRNWVFA